MPRQTADLIALILAVVVALLVLGTGAVLLLTTVADPQRDITGAVNAIGDLVSVLVAALVGYMAGRRTVNGNGH